ncbi:MAG: hypothetical protein ACI3ZP_06250 [Candidatus Cryptobacteroides sp.]
MIFKKKIDMEAIVPTSKMSLKMSCIRACGKDIKAAEQLYDFFVKDMPGLPDFDIVPPSPMKQITDGAMKVLGWIDSNQDKIAGYYNLFQQIRAGNPITPPLQDVPGVPPPPAE